MVDHKFWSVLVGHSWMKTTMIWLECGTSAVSMFLWFQVQRAGAWGRGCGFTGRRNTGRGDRVSHLLLRPHLQWQDALLQLSTFTQWVLQCRRPFAVAAPKSRALKFFIFWSSKLVTFLRITKEAALCPIESCQLLGIGCNFFPQVDCITLL